MNGMNNVIITGFFVLSLASVYGQGNTFPASGNVGIGTTAPTKKLDVLGAVKADELSFPMMSYNFELAPRTQLAPMSMKIFDDYAAYRPAGTAPGGNNYGTLLAIYGRSSHWQTDIYFGASDRKMYFRTSAYSAHNSDNGVGNFYHWRTILDSHSDVKSSGKLVVSGAGNHVIENGNLGIGTLNPTEKLAVNGTIRAKEIKVEASPWPDYVFDEEYNLRPLKEVKRFIRDQGHLPEVPKAEYIEKHGLSLGEMNTLLMKKIEELTLYVIQLEERLDEMERRTNKNTDANK